SSRHGFADLAGRLLGRPEILRHYRTGAAAHRAGGPNTRSERIDRNPGRSHPRILLWVEHRADPEQQRVLRLQLSRGDASTGVRLNAGTGIRVAIRPTALPARCAP